MKKRMRSSRVYLTSNLRFCGRSQSDTQLYQYAFTLLLYANSHAAWPLKRLKARECRWRRVLTIFRCSGVTDVIRSLPALRADRPATLVPSAHSSLARRPRKESAVNQGGQGSTAAAMRSHGLQNQISRKTSNYGLNPSNCLNDRPNAEKTFLRLSTVELLHLLCMCSSFFILNTE